MKHIYLFIYLLLCYNIAFTQCNNENDVIPEYLSNEGIAGQSFVANCSGRLTNLDIKWFNPNTINYSIRVLKGEGLNGPQVGSTLTGLQVNGTGDWYNFSDFISNDLTSNSIPLIEGQTYTFLIETDIGGVGTTHHNPASTTDGIFYYDIPGYVGSFDFSDIVYLMETNSDPVITNVTSTNTDGTYTLGDVVDVIVTFNEVVNVNTSGGLPELLLETGIIDQSASYISGTGTNQLTFRYNVQNGDSTTDLDYASNFALNLNGASIKDIENNDAVLSLPVTGTPGSLGANHDIVINCNITLSAIVQSNVLCNGGSDGSIDLTVSGGIAPYNYIWSNSATTEDMAGLFSGTYNVVVTDANGCTANTSVTVTEPTMLTASAMVSSS
ncbi:SprB repeat-containing protein, partial [Winogradskyella psychrotolerans]|uniref:SprB repeat-containing protein n=1 Tax=Winogradskyella psychrotolerans TaxID=1344585 RepID=UPI001C07E545